MTAICSSMKICKHLYVETKSLFPRTLQTPGSTKIPQILDKSLAAETGLGWPVVWLLGFYLVTNTKFMT